MNQKPEAKRAQAQKRVKAWEEKKDLFEHSKQDWFRIYLLDGEVAFPGTGPDPSLARASALVAVLLHASIRATQGIAAD
jgi:hypothetical protein